MTTETACGKIILFGEHAVVYGRPALAIPLSELRARAEVRTRAEPGVVIRARDVGREIEVERTPDDPLATIVRLTLEKLELDTSLEIEVSSEIPPASGLGSGAAVSTAMALALAAYFGRTLDPSEISALVYETEKMYHGTPSGIDNSVIAYEQPIRFVRGKGIERFKIARPFTLAIANTGIASPTKIAVGDVRRGWEDDPERYEKLFDGVAAVVEEAQAALARGEDEALPELMRRNQGLLRELGVSSLEIEALIEAGARVGVSGKLSGGGRGGNVIFYVEGERADELKRVLLEAGAVNVIVTAVG